jgi:lipoprotein-anchoring transpeptidase ErfK/SrfK
MIAGRRLTGGGVGPNSRKSAMRLVSLFRSGLIAAGLIAGSQAFAASSDGAFTAWTNSGDPSGQWGANNYNTDPGAIGGSRPMVAAIPRETVSYNGPYAPGTIIVSTSERRLYLVLPDHQALKYGIGVGRPGFTWGGVLHVSMKKEWPDWTPPAAMLKRRPDLPRHMKGGIDNPLGARALYLGSSEYRIHGSNEPDTIGTAVSSGCIRMTNDDVKDLYERVPVGAKVIVQN